MSDRVDFCEHPGSLPQPDRYRELFYGSPVSLWVVDCSGIGERLAQFRGNGDVVLREWLQSHPEELFEMLNTIRVEDVNPTTLELFGASEPQEFRNRIGTLFREDSLPQVLDWLIRLAAGESRLEGENVLYTLDGRRLIVHIRMQVAPGYEQTLGKVYSSVMDMTQLKRTEAALRTMNDQFRRLFDESPDAIFVESLGGVVLDANLAACELHQRTREELIGSHVLDLVPAEDWNSVFERTASIVTGQVHQFEGTSLSKDGSTVPISARVSTIDYEGQRALLLHVRDITERRREEQLRREQERELAHVSRLTIIGQLVAGIAHEIRQPLFSAANFADVCVELLKQPRAQDNLEQLQQVAQKLGSATRRANEITNRMLAFARKGTPQRQQVRLDELIRSAVEFTAPHAKALEIKTRMVIEEAASAVSCDRVLIEQTIVNLLNNAYQALSSKESGKREVEIRGQCDGLLALVSVSDNGPGLPAGVAPEQLFDSFFTTERNGMGIGLALSRSFIEQHGGTIRATANPSGGMTFQFTLSVHEESAANAASDRIRH